MVRAATLGLVLSASLLMGCSELRPVDPDQGQSWAAAKRDAYRGAAKLHKVTRGDTASEIAREYGVTLTQLASANDLRAPYVVRVGENLSIPQPGQKLATVPVATARPARRSRTSPASPMAPQSRQSSIQVATLAPLPAPAARPVPTVEPASVTSVAPVDPGAMARASAKRPPSLTGDGFLWPTAGSVISPFGHKSDGRANDGINIGAALGASVLSAENGVVSYASDGIPGWGRMVLIRHADGFTTGYAHLDSILTRVGDNVARGQVIGRVGQTGNVDSPQLHFELRSGKRALDPSAHLVKDGDVAVASR